MKIFYTIIFLISLSGCCFKSITTGKIRVINECGQTLENDWMSKWSGKVIVFRKNGEMAIMRYTAGKRNGVFSFFNSKGFLYEKRYYKSDSLLKNISHSPPLN